MPAGATVLTLCVSSACCCVRPETRSTSAVFKNDCSDFWCTFTSPWYMNSTSECRSMKLTSCSRMTGCLQGVLCGERKREYAFRSNSVGCNDLRPLVQCQMTRNSNVCCLCLCLCLLPLLLLLLCLSLFFSLAHTCTYMCQLLQVGPISLIPHPSTHTPIPPSQRQSTALCKFHFIIRMAKANKGPQNWVKLRRRCYYFACTHCAPPIPVPAALAIRVAVPMPAPAPAPTPASGTILYTSICLDFTCFVSASIVLSPSRCLLALSPSCSVLFTISQFIFTFAIHKYMCMYT